jgi:nucleotide-binding universal stress UspA family protein
LVGLPRRLGSRSHAETQTKLIIAATDGSQGAERSLAFAAELAKSLKAKLLLVHVSEDVFSGKKLMLLDRMRIPEGDALEEMSHRVLSRARAIAQDQGAQQVEAMSGGGGDPAKVLIDIIKQQHADAIVVGRRGRGQLEGLLLGSVLQKLCCLAPLCRNHRTLMSLSSRPVARQDSTGSSSLRQR